MSAIEIKTNLLRVSKGDRKNGLGLSMENITTQFIVLLLLIVFYYHLWVYRKLDFVQ